MPAPIPFPFIHPGDYSIMPEEQSLEGQAASKLIEMLLSSQLNNADKMDINIHTDLGKIAQGKMDSVSISSKDIVAQQGISVQELEVQTDEISINPLSALFGKLELNEPVNSISRVVLTEDDLNRTLSSDLLRDKQFVIQLDVEGERVPFKLLPPIEVRLPGEGKVAFGGNIEVFDGGREQQLQVQGTVYPRTDDHSVLLENFAFGQGQALSVEIMLAFIQKFKQLIHLPFLHVNGVAVQIQKLEVRRGSLALLIRAQITELPA
ncbi:DUF2993 domain-containing protein [Pseudanabaena sp. FACHB-2040]|uniref:LmeA family phospholipid-binding protein n=1 Tax=Pseudanabaena sp. FACHB-2040 TaxID=2692859 RepID=UPI0016846FDB|nr:DUF2993 domain-containing protein [Pseudanabaena sp. FACHB-2040]MBD2260094.1 DUF2993 domain-containing protein [Pseudanabaena sp. FACHB-2040]